GWRRGCEGSSASVVSLRRLACARDARVVMVEAVALVPAWSLRPGTPGRAALSSLSLPAVNVKISSCVAALRSEVASSTAMSACCGGGFRGLLRLVSCVVGAHGRSHDDERPE